MTSGKVPWVRCESSAPSRGLQEPEKLNLVIRFIIRLVPGLVEEEASHLSKSDSSSSSSSPSDEEEDRRSITPQNVTQAAHLSIPLVDGALSLASNSEDDEIGDGLRTFHHHGPQQQTAGVLKSASNQITTPQQQYSPSHGPTLKQQTTVPVERRRRKLPEIPKNKKRKFVFHSPCCGGKINKSV